MVKGKIIAKHGYGKSISTHPHKVTDTKSYQDEIHPFVQKLIDERNRAVDFLKEKDLTKVQYESLTRSIDLLTKNIELLTGGETERSTVVVIEQQGKDKYAHGNPRNNFSG